ncbi:MAG: hypothetical protein ABL900_19480 [Burkholderiaceae bacterium]
MPPAKQQYIPGNQPDIAVLLESIRADVIKERQNVKQLVRPDLATIVVQDC